MSDTTTPIPTTDECEAAVGSLHDGGCDMEYAVRLLLAHAGLPSDPAAVQHALLVRNALAMLDDPALY